jgi:hypothetical protein
MLFSKTIRSGSLGCTAPITADRINARLFEQRRGETVDPDLALIHAAGRRAARVIAPPCDPHPSLGVAYAPVAAGPVVTSPRPSALDATLAVLAAHCGHPGVSRWGPPGAPPRASRIHHPVPVFTLAGGLLRDRRCARPEPYPLFSREPYPMPSRPAARPLQVVNPTHWCIFQNPVLSGTLSCPGPVPATGETCYATAAGCA